MSVEYDTPGIVAPCSEIRTLLRTKDGIRALLLDQRSGGRHLLDSAAASVWALLDRPARPAELTIDVMETFGIDRDVATEAVDTALHAFRGMGLLADGSNGEPSRQDGDVRALPRDHDP